MRVTPEQEWKLAWDHAIWVTENAREAIEALSELTSNEEADMKLCFAANTTEGVRALLHEARRKWQDKT